MRSRGPGRWRGALLQHAGAALLPRTAFLSSRGQSGDARHLGVRALQVGWRWWKRPGGVFQEHAQPWELTALGEPGSATTSWVGLGHSPAS